MDWFYEGGGEPALLDVISIPLAKHAPHGHQSENHLMDATRFWRKRGNRTWRDIENLIDHTSSLWLNGDSTYYGCNDRIAEALAKPITNSLLLITPANVAITVLAPRERFGDASRKVRASFRFSGVDYDLMVTDPIVEAIFLAKPNGTYAVGQKVFLCISLADKPVGGHFYKLVAAIISERPL